MSGLLHFLLPLVSRKAAQRFERSAGDPEASQHALLHGLLDLNKDTAFGKEHGFAQIKDSKEYRKRVPIREFEGFRPYVNRLLDGENNILTTESPSVYATTSGTTGEPKFIPVTQDFRQSLADIARIWLRRAVEDHPGLLDHTVLSAVSPAIEGYKNDQPFGSMSGITYKNMPGLLRRQYTLPYSVMEIENYDLRYVIMMRMALEQQVSLAAAPNPSTWVRMATTGDKYAKHFIKAIRSGTLGYEDISDLESPTSEDLEKLESIKKTLRPNPTRAKELEDILEREGKLMPKDAWPHLAMIGCWLGGSAGIQAKLLTQYYGDVPMRDLGFRASEATMTIPLANNTAAGVLATHVNYYEFIPESEIEKDEPTVLESHELEVGQNYYILLTTASGLYRYDINDVVTVESFYRRTPIIAFVRKGRDMVSLTGEKLHVNQIIGAIDIAEKHGTIQTAQFRLIPDVDAMRYDLLVEVANESWKTHELEAFLVDFDFNLADLNNEYYQKRVSKRLQPPRLCIMKSGWAEREKRRAVDSGKRETQFKWQCIKLEWDEANEEERESFIETRHIPKDA